MLDGKHNIMEYPCKEIGKSVPYFEEIPRSNGTMNEFLLGTLELL
jgi:hypothetical protein